MAKTSLNKSKQNFFDRPKVLARVEKARRKNLSKCGAYVRTAARSMLRRRKRSSFPGQAPSVHSKKSLLTLKSIFFEYDPQSGGVIVGPVAVYGNKQDVPKLMEKGGYATRSMEYAVQYTKRGIQKKKLVLQKAAPRRVYYDPRPFMRPAMKKERKKFANVWKYTVKEA
jgi:hypothetical protein